MSGVSTTVTRTYLELRDPGRLRRAELPAGADAHFVHHHPCDLARYRALYRAVGERWHWRDRSIAPDDRLARELEASHVWELVVDGETAGYFELRPDGPGDVEILYFGLISSFIGRGFGGAMLTRAVDEAVRLGAARVWLHTCTLDSPRALPNYLARGFAVVRTEDYEVELGDPTSPA